MVRGQNVVLVVVGECRVVVVGVDQRAVEGYVVEVVFDAGEGRVVVVVGVDQRAVEGHVVEVVVVAGEGRVVVVGRSKSCRGSCC